MLKLRSRSMSQRLYLFMIIILVSLFCICFPLILNNYRILKIAQHDEVFVETLSSLVNTANEVSRERAYANRLMSSNASNRVKNRDALIAYRIQVNQSILKDIRLLEEMGYSNVAQEMQDELDIDLKQARTTVDAFAALPDAEKTSPQYDAAVQGMFHAWDNYRDVLKLFVIEGNKADTQLSDYITMILLLSDLRDQAGRAASNIISAVSFNEPIPDANRARSFQTQYQAIYLWTLIDTLMPQNAKTPTYDRLHDQVKKQYMDQGLAEIQKLLDESHKQQPYHLSGSQLTNFIVGKFTPVLDLQHYLLDLSSNVAKKQYRRAQQKFFMTLLMSIGALIIVFFTMRYVQRKIINPLVQAKEEILKLSLGAIDSSPEYKRNEFSSLFSAIRQLQNVLKQRDALEFQLRNIANTDALTGVSNRMALDDYLEILSEHPEKLARLCLMIIDIDNFKRVNDQFGHILGDEVIKTVAQQLNMCVRHSDLIIRYGGDEFLIVIEDISQENALIIAEKIRANLSQKCVESTETHEKIQVSVSIGVAVGAQSWLNLFTQADQALLRAKNNGKNTIGS